MGLQCGARGVNRQLATLICCLLGRCRCGNGRRRCSATKVALACEQAGGGIPSAEPEGGLVGWRVHTVPKSLRLILILRLRCLSSGVPVW